MKRKKGLIGLGMCLMLPGWMTFAAQGVTQYKGPVIKGTPIIQTLENTKKQVFYEDLDGNGKKEKIVVLAEYDEASGGCVLTLKINDRVMALAENWMGGEVAAHVVDIDQQDQRLELTIGGDACSSDYETYFYSYQKGKVQCIGGVEGTLKPVVLDKTYQMKVPGDGRIHTYERGRLIETWYHDATYALDQQGKLILQPQDYYMMGTAVTLEYDLPVYTAPSVSAKRGGCFVAGTKARLMLTDDEAWCQIEDNQGNSGWFQVKDGMGIQTTTGYRWSYEVFEGLFLAD